MKKKLSTLLVGGILGVSSLQGQVILQALDAPDVNTPPRFIVPKNTFLEGGEKFFTSIYDDDYLPFTMPTTAASWNRPTNADGTKERLIDYQGKITTEGIEIRIPILVDESRITLPRYETIVNVPANKTEDGISRDLMLVWEEQQLTDNDTEFIAKIKAIGGTLNIKKLDINSGLGSNFKGVELATFIYPYSSDSNFDQHFTLRVVTGIPDRKFGIETTIDGVKAYRHQFLYLPMVGEDGRVWLNNNLGAELANVESPNFNPAKEKKFEDRQFTIGSLFQWGRDSDGHEFMERTGKAVYPSVEWKTAAELSTFTEVCPKGFHTPVKNEWEKWIHAVTGVTKNPQFLDYEPEINDRIKNNILGIQLTGKRREQNKVVETHERGLYWSSTPRSNFVRPNQNRSYYLLYFINKYIGISNDEGNNSEARPIRCILNEGNKCYSTWRIVGTYESDIYSDNIYEEEIVFEFPADKPFTKEYMKEETMKKYRQKQAELGRDLVLRKLEETQRYCPD